MGEFMIKKVVLIFSLILFPLFVKASSLSGVMIGNVYYENLEDAIKAVNSNEVIKLLSDVLLDDSILIDKPVNIDLNGNDISSSTSVFVVDGGKLTLSGSGTVMELEPDYGVIRVIGSSLSTASDYSVVNVDSDVLLKGWAGVFVTHNNSKSYGVVVDLSGSIEAVNDINGGLGSGIYINGNIKDKNNYPVINIWDGAKIVSSGTGIYMAGYSNINIFKAHISGNSSGIGIKSGILNINGAEVVCKGLDKTPTEGDNNGIKDSGTTIQIESNSGYAGDMEIDISDGSFISKNSNVIYEYIGKGSNSLVKNINISSGTYISENNSSVFRFSSDFNNIQGRFVSGGKYTSDPSNYLKAGYSVSFNNDFYEVSKSTLNTLNIIDEYNNGNIFLWIGVLLSIGIVLFILYINRIKILNLLR